tara:strand:- start:572 stop:1954 length:1383 start_codon:yes stop_codon:yes gene_type:complete
MKKLVVILISAFIFFPLNHARAVEIVSYSLLVERDYNAFMVLFQTKDSGVIGRIIQLGGYQFFRDIHGNKWDRVITTISPAVADGSSYEEYFRQRYIINKINFVFNVVGSDEHLSFASAEATNVIKGYISQKREFSFSSLAFKDGKAEKWVSHSFYPVKTISDLITWSENNSYTFCQSLKKKIFNEVRNLEFKTENLKKILQSHGLFCDQNNDLVKTKISENEYASKTNGANTLISASSGTGFSVSSLGHVITNHHVIDGCQNVKIHFDGKSIPARVVTFDPQNDLALLKGDFRPSTVLSMSNQSPELLQDVYVAGYPFGRKVSTGVKVTKGIISSLTGIGNNFSQIQIDAALQPGNSGGPILDDRGNVVGVAVAKLDIKKVLKNYGVLPENTNFGIKTSVVRSILESSGVSLRSATRSSISKSTLGKIIAAGTYYLSCWMTMAHIEKIKSRKVIFQNLN